MIPPDQRRQFFRQLARETAVWFDATQGKPAFALADLPQLPAAALAALAPRIREGVAILPAEDFVSACVPGTDEPLALFAADAANLAVFNRFNGETPMGRIANELSATMDWPPEQAFAHVRWMFLRLVGLRVCVPANAQG